MKICLTSDVHGRLPVVPSCDLLIVAGDLCPDFAPGSPWGSTKQEGWLQSTFMNWVDSRAGCVTRATFGNHDFVSKKYLPDGVKGVFAVDEENVIGGLRIWFTPWSNLFGGWAWMKPPDELRAHYEMIPEGIDILVSHGPAYGYGDRVDDRYLVMSREREDPHVGSKELLEAIDRVKPRLMVCGHIHSGYGTYQYGETTIMNVALVDEDYKPVHAIVELEMEPK